MVEGFLSDLACDSVGSEIDQHEVGIGSARDDSQTLINERGALDLSWLRALEQEYKTLQATLHNWLSTPPQGMEAFGDQQRQVLRARRKIYTALDDAWRKVGPRHYDRNGRLLGQKIEWLEDDLAQQLRTLPALTSQK